VPEGRKQGHKKLAAMTVIIDNEDQCHGDSFAPLRVPLVRPDSHSGGVGYDWRFQAEGLQSAGGRRSIETGIIRHGLCKCSLYGFHQPFLTNGFLKKVKSAPAVGAFLIPFRISCSENDDRN
jgi:hypothetical protein